VLALQALCTFELSGASFDEQLETFLRDPENLEDLGWDSPPPASVLGFARELARGAWDRRERADALIRASAARWSLERMQAVDRNILRLGAYELLETPETPPAVVIDEAIELAKLFGGADSPAFVNGVLDTLRRTLDLAAGSDEASSADDGARES
jgi:N utilization substance protein B